MTKQYCEICNKELPYERGCGSTPLYSSIQIKDAGEKGVLCEKDFTNFYFVEVCAECIKRLRSHLNI